MAIQDVLVIGSGIAGLSYALKIAIRYPDAKITIVTKANEDETNTKYAQGGVAVVSDFEKDSFEKHIEDTLRAGDGLCKLEAVEVVVKEAPERINEIIDWGVRFDKNHEGIYDLGREGGHTENRIVHHKDITGWEIERAMLEAIKSYPNIKMLTHHFVVDLITEHHLRQDNTDKITCFGAYILDLNTDKVEQHLAKVTLLATGGVGHVYKNTTNPIIATGDGIGLARRAKATVSGMQFIQFHPTAFYSEFDGQLFLISEAVRGFGAKLRTKDGELFMHKYDEREELASRDIVARAIDNEMKLRGDDYVYIDCRHLEKEKFLEHFPNIYEKCKSEGYDMFTELVPVVPASHYLCGGIDVDLEGKTSIENLFAVGECSNTGLHGANRLASNSLLEAMVFGHRAALKTVDLLNDNQFSIYNFEFPEWNEEGMKVQEELVLISYLRKQLQAMMSELVGIVRSDNRLQIAQNRINEIEIMVNEIYYFTIVSPKILELRNLVDVAHLIIEQSINQKENRGTFYNKDFN
ncbi:MULTISPECIES: L-aspartate oxidase [unclassified Empedobacter]|uniref:L-aspartate oxidase n=1 Tax=unclassified Empedobacter TaxID=2643773 RepID=UPI0025B8C8C7|nr:MULTISPECIES: L-aspartate oxidase [unclassified Empedobacter]